MISMNLDQRRRLNKFREFDLKGSTGRRRDATPEPIETGRVQYSRGYFRAFTVFHMVIDRAIVWPSGHPPAVEDISRISAVIHQPVR